MYNFYCQNHKRDPAITFAGVYITKKSTNCQVRFHLLPGSVPISPVLIRRIFVWHASEPRRMQGMMRNSSRSLGWLLDAGTGPRSGHLHHAFFLRILEYLVVFLTVLNWKNTYLIRGVVCPR